MLDAGKYCGGAERLISDGVLWLQGVAAITATRSDSCAFTQLEVLVANDDTKARVHNLCVCKICVTGVHSTTTTALVRQCRNVGVANLRHWVPPAC